VTPDVSIPDPSVASPQGVFVTDSAIALAGGVKGLLELWAGRLEAFLRGRDVGATVRVRKTDIAAVAGEATFAIAQIGSPGFAEGPVPRALFVLWATGLSAERTALAPDLAELMREWPEADCRRAGRDFAEAVAAGEDRVDLLATEPITHASGVDAVATALRLPADLCRWLLAGAPSVLVEGMRCAEGEAMALALRNSGVPAALGAAWRFSKDAAPRRIDPIACLASRAANTMRRDGRTSIASVQRRLQLGYQKAALVVQRLEAEGVLGAPDPQTGRRPLLIPAQDI